MNSPADSAVRNLWCHLRPSFIIILVGKFACKILLECTEKLPNTVYLWIRTLALNTPLLKLDAHASFAFLEIYKIHC